MLSKQLPQNWCHHFFWWGCLLFLSSGFLFATLGQSDAPVSGAKLVQKAEATLQQNANGDLQSAIALYQAAALTFRQNSEFEAEALAWHRVSQLASKAGYRYQAEQAADKARMIMRSRTLPSSSYSPLADAQAARAYLTLGRIYMESGELQKALDAYQSGLYLANNAKLPREIAAAQVALGLLASEGNELDIAIQMTAASLDFWRQAKDFNGEAMALHNLARFYEKRNDLNSAAEFDAQAVNIYRLNRNRKAEGSSLQEALRVYLILGNFEASITTCEHLVSLAHGNNDSFAESKNLLALALIEASRENFVTAYQVMLKAFIVSDEQNNVIREQIQALMPKLEAMPKKNKSLAARETLVAQAEYEAQRGDFSAAYQLLLRALVQSDGKTEITDAMLNKQIKILARQFEARQKNLTSTRP